MPEPREAFGGVLRAIIDRLVLPEDRADFWREFAIAAEQVPLERRRRWIGQQLRASLPPLARLRLRLLVRQWGDDAHYAYRALRGSGRSTALTVATLGAGLAATVTVFGVLRAVLLAPLPFPAADELYLLRSWQPLRSDDLRGVSGPDFIDMRAAVGSELALGAFDRVSATLTGTLAMPLKVDRARTNAEALSIVGVPPIAGRWFTPEEETRGSAVVLISEGLWTSLFGRDRSVIGDPLDIDGVRHVVVGVMPGSFQLPGPGVALWTPLGDEVRNLHRRAGVLDVVFRADAADRDRVAELSALEAERLEAIYPATNEGRTTRIVSLVDDLAGDDGTALRALMAGAIGLLMIAFMNTLGLIATRVVARREELTLRLALGSPMRRLRRQISMEIAGSIVAAMALAFVLAGLGLRVTRSLWPSDAFLIAPIQLDWVVIATGAVASLLLTIVASVLPAVTVRTLSVTRRGVAAGVRGRALLTAGQLTVVVVLLGIATSVVGGYVAMVDVNRGVDTANLLVARVDLPSDRYPTGMARYPDWPEVQQLYAALDGSLRAEPQVLDVGLAGSMPLRRASFRTGVGLTTTSSLDTVDAAIQMVSDGWRTTVGAEVIAGRGFTASDAFDADPVAIVNESFARAYLGDPSILGGTVSYLGADRRIVGVIRDQIPVPGVDAQPTVFAPIGQTPSELVAVVVRIDGRPEEALGLIRRVVADVDPLLAVYEEQPLSEFVASEMSRPTLNTSVVTLFGVAGLLVAAMGLFSFVAHLVTTMRGAIAVRIALGADLEIVSRLIIGSAATPVLSGLLAGSVGLGLALPAVRVVLPDAAPPGYGPLVAAGSILMVTAMLAVLPSVLRAWRTDPSSSLKAE